jgi:hypothetical protein
MNEELNRKVGSWQQRLMILGVVLLVTAAVDGFFHPEQFFRSYLLGFMFWFGLSLGCSAFLLLNHLTGGKWGIPVRRPLEAGVRTFPLAALFLLPLLFGMHHLFLWTHKDIVAASPVLRLKSIYLNVPFFLVRQVLYFAFWFWITGRLTKWSSQLDRTGDVAFKRRLEGIGGWGLVAYGLTVTFFAIDWVMSLEAYWFSTIFGLIFIVIQVQAGIAFSVLVARIVGQHEPVARMMTPERFIDLGNLLLTFVMLWAYLAFSQFLIIWTGNLLSEIPWYLSRAGHGWAALAVILIVFYFAVPFFLLLMRDIKKHTGALARVCILLLVLNFADLFWMIVPSFHPNGPRLYLLDLLLPLGIGGIWLAFYLSRLKSYPLFPEHDPDFAGAFEYGD